MNSSLDLAKSFLGQTVKVTIDRPLGSNHPKHGFEYLLNYGFIEDTKSSDGEELDAYVLGESKPVDSFEGKVIAVIHRLDDDDPKLIVCEDGMTFTDEEIIKLTEFQEKFFTSEVIRS